MLNTPSKVALALLIPSAIGHICIHKPKANPGTDLADCAPTTQGACQGKMDGEVSEEWQAGSQVQIEWRRPGSNALDQNPAGQARHNGGINEFSLKCDGDDDFKAIARAVRNFPDVGVKFPLTIPSDVPDGKCLFMWNWTPATSGAPEFYSNCATVRIINSTKVATTKCGRRKGGPSYKTACKAFQALKPDVKMVNDGHGNNPGDGYDPAFVNTEGCPDGGEYPADKWSAMFSGGGAGGSTPAQPAPGESAQPIPEPESPATPETPAAPANPEEPADAIEETPEGQEAPQTPEQPAVEPPQAPQVPEPEEPSNPAPVGEGQTCSVNGHYCKSSDPANFYSCVAGQLLRRPMAPGTRCRCGAGAVAIDGGLCPMA